MIKLWTKIKRKRKNNPKSRKRKEIKKMAKETKKIQAQNKNRKNFKSKRRKENLDRSHIALIIANGRRKIDWRKMRKYSS